MKTTKIQAETLECLSGILGCSEIKTESAGFRGIMVTFKTEAGKFGSLLLGAAGACKGKVDGKEVANYDELSKMLI